MMNDNQNLQQQELTAALEQMRQNLYKAVDNTVAAIARIGVNLTPAELAELIRLFLGSAYETPAAAQAPIQQTVEPQTENETKSQTAPQPKAPVKRKRVTDWTKSSDNALRLAYSNRRRGGMAIEPELDAELARRFPGYDATTQTFVGNKRFKGAAHPAIAAMAAAHKKPMTEWADVTLKHAYYKARRNGNISAELNAELSRRFPEYDATTQKFVTKSPKTSTCKKSLADLTDNTLKTMYYKLRDKGISAELNEELARRFPAYDKKTRTFVRLYQGERIATQSDIEEIEHQQALAAARQRAEERAKKAAQRSAFAPAKTAPTARADKDDSDLVVTTKCLRISQDGPHYDVFVNGKRILHNHIGTQLQTFLNGTVLGVYGCVTDIPNFPDNPSWQVYDTNMKRRTFTQVHPYTKKSVYIKNIAQFAENQIRLEVSNKLLVLMDQRPSQRIFKIMSENTK